MPSTVEVIAAVIGFGGFLYGFALSIGSFLLTDNSFVSNFCVGLYGDDDECQASSDSDKPAAWVSFCQKFSGMLYLGTILGYLSSGFVSDILGRKKSMIIYTTIFSLSFFGLASSDTIAWVMFWRIFTGIGCAGAVATAPVYTAELSPRNIRGMLVGIVPFIGAFGTLFADVIAYSFSSVNNGWRYETCVAAFLGLCLLIALFFIPESPRWLLSHAGVAECRAVLLLIDNLNEKQVEDDLLIMAGISGSAANHHQNGILADSDDEDEHVVSSDENGNMSRKRKLEFLSQFSSFNSYSGQVNQQQPPPTSSSDKFAHDFNIWIDLFHSSSLLKRVLFGSIFHILQQLAGMQFIHSYGAEILSDVGVYNDYLGMGIIYSANLLGLYVGIMLVDTVGRRVIAMHGCYGMLFGHVSSAACIYFGDLTDEDDRSDVLKICFGMSLALFVFFYSMSIGHLAWSYLAEIFPSRFRAKATSLCLVAHGIGGYLSTFSIDVSYSIGLSSTFMLLALDVAIVMVFLFRHMIETAGVELEDVEPLFRTANDGDETTYLPSANASWPFGFGGDGKASKVLDDEVKPILSKDV